MENKNSAENIRIGKIDKEAQKWKRIKRLWILFYAAYVLIALCILMPKYDDLLVLLIACSPALLPFWLVQKKSLKILQRNKRLLKENDLFICMGCCKIYQSSELYKLTKEAILNFNPPVALQIMGTLPTFCKVCGERYKGKIPH